MADSRKYSTNIDLQGNSIINGGFEQVVALPLNGYDGETVSFRGKLYTWYNGKWNDIADDLGGVEETREEQFTYQATANDESVKDGLAIVKSIKGNTVVANQLFKYLNVLDNETGTYKFLVGRYTFPLNHKLLIKFNYSNSSPNLTTISCGLSNYGSLWGSHTVANVSVGDNLQLKFIATNLNANNNTLYIFNSNALTGFSIDTDSIQFIDLTQMFEEGNEPTSVEEFERLYPNLPTEYNEGSLLNLDIDSIKSVGFNAFNGEYAQVLGGMQYYLGGSISSLAFKENLEDEGEVIEIPSDNLYTPATNGYLVATGSDICINLSHSGYRNGEYEPYKESIVNLPIKKYFPDGMKSAGEVRDEIVWDEGLKKYKAIKRVGSVDMGTLNWKKNSNEHYFYSNINDIKSSPYLTAINMLCVEYKTVNVIDASGQDKVIYIYPSHIESQINIVDSSYNDVAFFKQSLQGQILYYELQTPIETIIDDYDLIDYEVSDFGTEEIIADEPTTPIIADIQYGFNAVDEIRNHRFEIRDLKKLVSRGVNLNGVTVNLGGTFTIPAYIPYDDVLYPVRIQGNWLQIYRNGVWGNLFNLASKVIPSLYIEEFEGDWYNPNILEYILSDELTTKLISETLDFRSILTSIAGFAGVKLSLQAFSPKEYDKSLTNILNALTGYVVYVENDIDTMFNSGNSVLVKLNFDSVNRVTIECYIQR